jgi:hypothetical protein
LVAAVVVALRKRAGIALIQASAKKAATVPYLQSLERPLLMRAVVAVLALAGRAQAVPVAVALVILAQLAAEIPGLLTQAAAAADQELVLLAFLFHLVLAAQAWLLSATRIFISPPQPQVLRHTPYLVVIASMLSPAPARLPSEGKRWRTLQKWMTRT